MSGDELVEAAERAGAACDLEAGLPARAAELAEAVVEVFRTRALDGVSPRALWNLLWLAADLTLHVDVYRARGILRAVEQLFERHFSRVLDGPGEAAEAAEMAFDFFFNRPEQPLSVDDALGTLGRVLALDNRYCRRAALHGLGHLWQQHADARPRIEAAIDACADPALADYAARARTGDLL